MFIYLSSNFVHKSKIVKPIQKAVDLYLMDYYLVMKK